MHRDERDVDALAADLVSIADCHVDPSLDAELRALLAEAFGAEPFAARRHANEIPTRRFLIRSDGGIAAHLAAHEKLLHTEREARGCLGIAEVAVAPAYRGRGLVRVLLDAAEGAYAHLDHALLLGDLAVYGSSGYRPLDGVAWPDDPGAEGESLLGKHLAAEDWPAGARRLHGPRF